MFAAKPVYPTSNLHLPPINKTFRRRVRLPPPPTRNNREPILKQELLKNSLCRMGIDSDKAERLVSTCLWYVYQFEKDLKISPEQTLPMNCMETKKINIVLK
jgi:hypothetical protein